MSSVYQPIVKNANGIYIRENFQKYESVGQLTHYQQKRLKKFLQDTIKKEAINGFFQKKQAGVF